MCHIPNMNIFNRLLNINFASKRSLDNDPNAGLIPFLITLLLLSPFIFLYGFVLFLYRAILNFHASTMPSRNTRP